MTLLEWNTLQVEMIKKYKIKNIRRYAKIVSPLRRLSYNNAKYTIDHIIDTIIKEEL